MHFSGENAANLETTVLDVLENVLSAGFAAPGVAPQFRKWGGVRITRRPEEGAEWFEKSKRPFVFVQLEGDDQFGWQKVVSGQLREGTRHELTIGIEAVCSMPCADAEKPLKNALRRILENAYFTLRDAGLEGAKVRVMKPEEQPDRRNPVQVTTTAYTL